ncbi:DUF7519 family protein [Halococcus thailandensis]|uniref:Uncharacterized protein n=1 Tax=Halococcus thailandensis JCM 13552 TaxID=1227457 RepID=M0NBK1_9EURY|nr:hypothetical protein [Halococcus thailandensis]EMA54025.1 hypothetical protein C451_07137 [Halococcus thailandensis JCM 13552]
MSGSAIDHAPPRTSTAIGIGVAVVGTLSLALSGPAAVVGAVGVVGFAVGLRSSSRAAVTLGAAGLFCGTVLAGLAGAPSPLLLAATAATVVAWDVAEFGIDLGETVGRAATTRRAEFVHAGTSGALALVGAGGGSIVYRLAGGGPALVPIALLFGAVVLVLTLRP